MNARLTIAPAALGCALLLAACNSDVGKGDTAAPPEGAKGAAGAAAAPPMGPPPYITRDLAPAGNRLAVARDPKAVFQHACGYCHLEAGMGTNLLVKQRIAAGAPPETALLANRDDLTADYVKQVVRQGKNAMPPQTRVDITDAELDEVAKWLAKGK